MLSKLTIRYYEIQVFLVRLSRLLWEERLSFIQERRSLTSGVDSKNALRIQAKYSKREKPGKLCGVSVGHYRFSGSPFPHNSPASLFIYKLESKNIILNCKGILARWTLFSILQDIYTCRITMENWKKTTRYASILQVEKWSISGKEFLRW